MTLNTYVPAGTVMMSASDAKFASWSAARNVHWSPAVPASVSQMPSPTVPTPSAASTVVFTT